MGEIREHRNNVRIKRKANVLVESYSMGTYHEAKMFNFSHGGMYFETDYAPLPGTEITIGIENSPYNAGADVYRAQVRWRRALSRRDSRFNYGVGVKYQSPINA